MNSELKISPENNGVITHDFPVWREKANFILALSLAEPDVPKQWKFEQIWARKLEDNIFEVCCIPFFAYGVALGDLVTTHTLYGKQYIINNIVEKSGHATYRIWFLKMDRWTLIIEDIKKLGGLVEIRWEKSQLVAVDVSTYEIKSKLELYLRDLESIGILACEAAT